MKNNHLRRLMKQMSVFCFVRIDKSCECQFDSCQSLLIQALNIIVYVCVNCIATSKAEVMKIFTTDNSHRIKNDYFRCWLWDLRDKNNHYRNFIYITILDFIRTRGDYVKWQDRKRQTKKRDINRVGYLWHWPCYIDTFVCLTDVILWCLLYIHCKNSS